MSNVRDLVLPRPVEAYGSGKIELFDERQRLVERVPFENYVGADGLAHNRWAVRQDYWKNMPSPFSLDSEPFDPFRNIVLTSDTSPEDVGERWVLGVPVGWANKTVFAGTDIFRGTPSVESFANGELTTWVFDWPTHAAVGLIQSVCWTQVQEVANFQCRPCLNLPQRADWINAITPPGFSAAAFSPGGSGSASNRGVSDLAFGPDGGLWVMPMHYSGAAPSNVSIAKFDPLNPAAGPTLYGPTLGDLGIGGNAVKTHIAMDATQMYVAGGAIIRRSAIPTSQTAPTQTAVPTPNSETNIRGLAYDGSMLWVVGGSGTFYRINKTTGAVDRQFTPELQFSEQGASYGVQSLGYDPGSGHLWARVYGSHSGVQSYYRFDLNGNVIGIYSAYTRNNTGPWAAAALDFNAAGVGMLIDVATNGFPRYTPLERTNYGNLGTRARLPAPVTKTNLQTMKVTYTFNYA